MPMITFKFNLTEFAFQLTNLANDSSLGRNPQLKAEESHGFSQRGGLKRLVSGAAFERQAHFVITCIQATGLQPDSNTKDGVIRKEKSLKFKLRNVPKPRTKTNNGVKVKISPENELAEGQTRSTDFGSQNVSPSILAYLY